MPSRIVHSMLCFTMLAVAALGGGTVPPPNIVLILADDLGWGEVGCQGQEKIPTPNIDRLAAEGMRLTSHWSGSPVCAPSRCVLLTGKHPGHAVVRDNWENGGWGEHEAEGQYPLPPGEVTLAEVLADQGYDTCAVGKWGLGGPGTAGHPNAQGFGHWFGYLCQRKAHNYYPTHLWRNEHKVPLEGNAWFSAHQKLEVPLDGEAEYRRRYQAARFAPDLIRDEAVAFIETQSGEAPFFLFYASPVPHVALQTPWDRLDAFPSEWDDTPYLGQKGYVPHPRPRAAYAAMIAGLDAEVGALLDALEQGGHTEDTIVIFTSDNGPTWAGGVDHAFFDSNGPFRGLKGSVFEGGLRVPMIVRWPGRVKSGSLADVAGGFEDHLPTICDVVGAATPAGTDGTSFLPTLLGRVQPERATPLYRELSGQQAVRDGPWKGVRRHLSRGDTTMMVFDLEADPGETTDLASQRPDIVARLADLMASQHVASEAFPLAGVDMPASDP